MAVGGRFNVDMEALACSASHVAGQTEDLATAHLSSDNEIEAAQSGWVGMSGAALSVKAEDWLEKSRTLLTRVGGHAMALNNDAVVFATAEHENVAKMHGVGGSRTGA
jgi:uncharacterized protein YukE